MLGGPVAVSKSFAVQIAAMATGGFRTACQASWRPMALEFTRPSSTVYRAWWWSNYLSKALGHLSVGFSVSAGAASVAHCHSLAPCSRSAARQAATILSFGDVEVAR